jgi:hypothetical protein
VGDIAQHLRVARYLQRLKKAGNIVACRCAVSSTSHNENLFEKVVLVKALLHNSSELLTIRKLITTEHTETTEKKNVHLIASVLSVYSVVYFTDL